LIEVKHSAILNVHHMANNKHRNRLREWAKFFSGLVAADLIGAIWFASSGFPPYTILGINLTASLVNFGIAFDIFLFITLVHYAWHPSILEPNFSRRGLFIFIGIFTGFVAIVHIFRLALGLDLELGSFSAPMWLSWLGAIITAFISYTSFHFIKK